MNYRNAPSPIARPLLDRIGALETERETRRRAGTLTDTRAREIVQELRELRGKLGGAYECPGCSRPTSIIFNRATCPSCVN